MVQPAPAAPNLIRVANDKAALEALTERGPLTRPEIGALLGLSKPTASQLLARLQDAGLVIPEGTREGGPGRAAEVYRINPGTAYVAGLDVSPTRISASVADISGAVVGEYLLPTPGRTGVDAVERVRSALTGACLAADVPLTRLRRTVIGIQGAVDPATGRLGYAAHLPGWRMPHLLTALRDGLDGLHVAVENDVNLVAMAEQTHGVARAGRNFVLMWAGDGLGMAVVLGGRLHRGATGGAGEIGYMPVPGAPLPQVPGRSAAYGLHALTGGPAVRTVLRSYGFRGPTLARAVQSAAAALTADPAGNGDEAARAKDALDDIATRLALGLAAVVAVLDPELVVLAGDVAVAGGETLRALVEQELHLMTIPKPPLRLSTVEGNPVLTGARRLALLTAREDLFASTTR
ncbi:ROK family transcriptional regulator [Rhizohabitans arisaemae]|uniref:ROK family transcriptional regulator n=1 Tax=Rhizohabitans arisaemae TaxID=2720610 RepID=UPI0024B0E978|nr:ROK family transcriptional regulator [Rhizohabitans arisaemae]